MALTPRALVGKVSRRATTSSNPAIRNTYRTMRQTARNLANRVSDRQFGWVGTVRAARWVGPTAYEVQGWAYERGFGYPDAPPSLEIWLECGSRQIRAEVTLATDPEVNASSPSSEFDYANTAFTARFELAQMLDLVDDPEVAGRPWQARVRISGPDRAKTGHFKSLYRLGSARHLFAHTFAADPFAGREVQIVEEWAPPRGLVFHCRRPAVYTVAHAVEGRTFTALIRSNGPVLTGAGLQTLEAVTGLALTEQPRDGGSDRFYRIVGDVAADYPPEEDPASGAAAVRRFLVHDHTGVIYPVATDLDDRPLDPAPGDSLVPSGGYDGGLVLLDAPARLIVDAYEPQKSPRLGIRLRGRLLGRPDPVALSFLGQYQTLPVEATFAADGTFDAFCPLYVAEWGGPALPPRSGGYGLMAVDAGGTSIAVTCQPAVLATTPRAQNNRTFRVRFQVGIGRRPRFHVSPPRRANELGYFHQRRLERHYKTGESAPVDAVYFESFYGRNATCNPKALDAEIARRFPDLPRYWGIVDASVPVPEGAVPVVRGTKEFWEARATSRYVIANDWLRRTFVPQPYQVVLQTWHGSMLKRIGLDRPKVPREKRRMLLVEQAKWDLLLSQNRHSTDILRTAYDWSGPIVEEGYPRDDALTTGDGQAIRARLGVRPDQTAILYAPTWREGLTTMVTFLDLQRLTAELGEKYVILLRGHSRTMEGGERVAHGGVIDVTTYPEVTELFMAADAMITDYSSVMFDYSITRRPMIFFVPDMDDYRDSTRGVYFDLSEVAPGPVLSTQEEVATAIRELDEHPARYAERYDAWLARFNHHDDGHAAERVIDQLINFVKQPVTPPIR